MIESKTENLGIFLSLFHLYVIIIHYGKQYDLYADADVIKERWFVFIVYAVHPRFDTVKNGGIST